MARWDSGPESEQAKNGEGDLAGPEFEVLVKPRRGPGGPDLDEAVADYDQKDSRAGGRKGP